MERAVMWFMARLRLALLLSLWCPGAQAARSSLWHRGTQAARILGELPPCKDVWGGIPGWDCFDPPTHDLPPCDFHHQSAGIDCGPRSPPKPQASTLLMDHDASRRVQGALPSCNDVPGGISNWDCYDPPRTPLPPCDFKHQNPGIDCSTDSQKPRRPPAPKAVISAAASTQDLDTINAATQSVQGQLPPCKDVPGGTPNVDCYDPPRTPLPPCDFRHQNPGIDCSTDPQKPRPAPPAPMAVISAAASTQPDLDSTNAATEKELPPCKDVPGGIQNWDCYDPPSTPLPPCDNRHIDCDTHSLKPPPAPKAKQGATDIADFQ